ncbi:MAG: phosphoribosylformylglycinamidine synthase subunit PurS [Candidatus Methanomethylicia archaeon]
MAVFKVRVEVKLKPGFLDPEGETVKHTLNDLGYKIIDARICKVYELVLDTTSLDEAKRISDEVCRRLLANPVKDIYRVEVFPYALHED